MESMALSRITSMQESAGPPRGMLSEDESIFDLLDDDDDESMDEYTGLESEPEGYRPFSLSS
jgi:hypothetical protein